MCLGGYCQGGKLTGGILSWGDIVRRDIGGRILSCHRLYMMFMFSVYILCISSPEFMYNNYIDELHAIRFIAQSFSPVICLK